jgi:hypothetical protein
MYCRAFGEHYAGVVQKRKTLSTHTVMAKLEGLQALTDTLQMVCESESVIGMPSSDMAQVEKLRGVVKGAEDHASKLVKEFAQFQREVRQCAASADHDQDVVASKLSSRDSARARLSRGLRDVMATLTRDAHKGEVSITHAQGRDLSHEKVSDAQTHLQLLESAVVAARECIIQLNVGQSDATAGQRVGADFDATSCKQGDVQQALSLWRAWKDTMCYEDVAKATDTCMQAAHAVCTQRLGAVFGIDTNQQEHGQYERIKEALATAADAVDSEAALHACNPMRLVPVTPLFRAAESLVLAMKALVAVLQHACTVYDTAFYAHEAEMQCLDATGARYVEMQQAVSTVQAASKAHSKAQAKLKKDKLMEQHPDLAEEEGLTQEQVRDNIKEKKKVLKDTAQALQHAVMSLLALQDSFPEVCRHLKAGLPADLLAVWRPDLTMDMFEARTVLHTASNHKIHKGSMHGKTFALKEFEVMTEEGLKELMREAAALRRLRHPAIVEILAVFEDTSNKTMLLQMPFFEHGTLDTWVEKEAPEWRAVRTVLLDIAGALEHLHASSVVHCDVKPGNILVAAFCRGRLADFDLSVDYATRTSTTFASTKLHYTAGFDAPELHRYEYSMYVCMYLSTMPRARPQHACMHACMYA